MMNPDVVVVGAGFAGLSAAVRLTGRGLRVVTDTGTQAAAFGRESSILPPAVSASRKPSPVLPVGPGEKCSAPVGASPATW